MDMDSIVSKAFEISRNPYEFKKLLEDLRNELEFEKRLRDGKPYLILNRIHNIVFFGDIHGDIHTFLELSKKLNIVELLRNGTYVVFLGDYIDRGMYQIETLASISMLKLEWKDRIILLRGNHEPPPWLTPYPHDYPYILATYFGRDAAEDIYRLSMEVFELLPLALYVPEHFIAFHGGPPVERILEFETPDEILNVSNDTKAIEDILWSDPIDEDIDWMPSFRGAGKLWGYKITSLTLDKLSIRMIIRAHEPCMEGFKLNHGGKVLTLFSMKGYYGNAYAAALHIDLDNTWYENIEQFIVRV